MKSRSTLATWLSELDGSRLARVLAMRKDVVSSPEPRSVGELADRLQRPGSVALVLPQLTLPCLQAAEALAALGPRATRDSLAELLGLTSPAAVHALDATLKALSDRALLWHDGNETLCMPTPLRQAWSTPLGLDAPLEELLAGTSSEELRGMLAVLGIKPPGTKQQRLAALVEHHTDAERVAALVAGAPAATRKLLEQSAGSTPRQSLFVVFGAPGRDLQPGARWALDRGLLVAQDRHRYGPARMPAEVAFALRGPGWHAPFVPLPPFAQWCRSPGRGGPGGRGRGHRVRACRLRPFGVRGGPPTRLKSGGIGARELARLGKAAQAGTPSYASPSRPRTPPGCWLGTAIAYFPPRRTTPGRSGNLQRNSPYCSRHGGTCRSPPARLATRTTGRFPLSPTRRRATAAYRPATGCSTQPRGSRQGRA